MPRLVAHRRVLVPPPKPPSSDPLERKITAPTDTIGHRRIKAGLLQHFIALRSLGTAEYEDDCQIVRMPNNSSTAREDLTYMQTISWFGQDILLATQHCNEHQIEDFGKDWNGLSHLDYLDWRAKMRFLMYDMQKDIAAEVAWLSELNEDGSRRTPTDAYFLWKAWTWDLVVPMTFRVRYDVMRVVSKYLLSTFRWASNDYILRGALRLTATRRRYLPHRELKGAWDATPEEKERYLTTDSKKREAALYMRYAWSLGAVWTGVEEELQYRMTSLHQRFHAIAEELLHLQAMMRELRLPDGDEYNPTSGSDSDTDRADENEAGSGDAVADDEEE